MPQSKRRATKAPSAVERDRRDAQSAGLESARRRVQTVRASDFDEDRFMDFDAAAAERKPLGFKVGGKIYAIESEPPVGPLLKILAEGKVNNPAESLNVISAVLGRKLSNEILGFDRPDDGEFLARAIELLDFLHEAKLEELGGDGGKEHIWDDIDTFLSDYEEQPEPTGAVGLSTLLEVVKWLLRKLGFDEDSLSVRDDDDEGDPGNVSRSPKSSGIGER